MSHLSRILRVGCFLVVPRHYFKLIIRCVGVALVIVKTLTDVKTSRVGSVLV